MTTHPAAPLDGHARIITYATLAFFAFSVVTEVPLAPLVGAAALALPTILGISVLATWAMAPVSYDLVASHLSIRRHWLKPIRIPLNVVTHVSYQPHAAGWKTVRTFGDGGLFGWIGHFASPDLGAFRMYCTNRAETVLVETRGGAGKILVSPADPRAFEAEMRHAVVAAKGALGERSSPADVPKPALISPAYLAIPVGLYLSSVWIMAYNYTSLPSRVATHFGLTGRPDSWMSPLWFVISIGGIGLFLLVVTAGLFFWMPRVAAPRFSTGITVALLSLVQLAITYASADIVWYNRWGLHAFSVDVAVGVLILLVIVLLGLQAWWELREAKY